MNAQLATILSVILVGIISFVGVLFLAMNHKRLQNILLYLVAFSVGGLLGGAFLHLLPETAEELGITPTVGLTVLAGFLLSLIVEKTIHWHHCHDPSHKHVKPFAYINLLGEIVHNFLDGILIAAAYFVSFPVGLATTFAVVLHEIPQEIGDFAVLIHAGFSRAKALLVNFLVALFALVGALLTLVFYDMIEPIVPYLLPFAAGTFLYLAGADLIPELLKETKTSKSILQVVAIVMGIAVMAALLLLEGH